MKKILGVIVAVTLSLCLLLPTAFAEETTVSFEDYFEGIDFSGYSYEELEALLEGFDLGTFDLEAFYNNLVPTTDEEGTTAETTETTTQLTGSTLDITWLTDLITTFDTESIETMFEDFDIAQLDELLTVVADSMANAGVDLSIFDLSAIGNLDIQALIDATTNAGSTSYTTTDIMAGLADSLLAGLESLGLDTTTIEALLDNEIVNFFANLYLGYVDGEVPDETTTAAPTTTVPPVVTTSVPETGDTSAVVTAIATLSLASAAAFLCLKKKED